MLEYPEHVAWTARRKVELEHIELPSSMIFFADAFHLSFLPRGDVECYCTYFSGPRVHTVSHSGSRSILQRTGLRAVSRNSVGESEFPRIRRQHQTSNNQMGYLGTAPQPVPLLQIDHSATSVDEAGRDTQAVRSLDCRHGVDEQRSQKRKNHLSQHPGFEGQLLNDLNSVNKFTFFFILLRIFFLEFRKFVSFSAAYCPVARGIR